MYEKAIAEIEIIKNFQPDLTIILTNNIDNKINIAINKDGFRISDIISKLKPGENLIFALNDGWEPDAIGTLFINKKYQGSIFWKNTTFGDYVRISSDKGSILQWGSNIAKMAQAELEKLSADVLFSTIVEDIKRLNLLEGKTIPEKFIKFNEEFGEFAAEVVKMLGMSHKSYDEEHLIEESADAFQVILSTMLAICERQNIDFKLILEAVLEKNKKWEAKIPEYKRISNQITRKFNCEDECDCS